MTAAPEILIDYAAIADEIWKRLGSAADNNDDPMRLHVVATVDRNNRPNARTLVLRGARRDESLIWFHTDVRTPKVEHLRANPSVCAVCYDPRIGLQLRIDGIASIHHNDRLSRRHWSQYDLAVRYAYGISHCPGEPLAENDPRLRTARRHLAEGRDDEGFEHFAVIEMRVESIDWFQSTAMTQRRATLQASRGWQAMPLAP